MSLLHYAMIKMSLLHYAMIFGRLFVKTVRPMLSVRCPVCLWRSCTVAKQLDGSRWNFVCR